MARTITELVLSSDDMAAIRSRVLGDYVESCAILFAYEVKRTDGLKRLLVREIVYPSPDDYTRRGSVEAELRPEFVANVTKRARIEKTSLIFLHSHPGDHPPTFSPVDNWGEARLAKFLSYRHPSVTHAAVVLSAGGLCARLLGTEQHIRVIGLGTARTVLFDPAAQESTTSDVHDRQVRAFGDRGQKTMQQLRVAIVGLGGTGSIVSEQLAHLGVRKFILIDADVLEKTNLNRVVNASSADIGRPKVRIAQRYINKIKKNAVVTTIEGDITQSKIAQELLNADLIFGCTDSHGSRAVIQQISYQYLIPCIDMGTVIAVKEDEIKHVYGRAQLLAPGLACFTCSGLLNAAEVRRDMMNAFERQQDPYLQGAREPAPAVISLNGTIASLAVTMFLSVVTGVPMTARHILYNAINSTLRSARAEPDKECFICSRVGSFARGNSWPLLARQD